MSYIQFFILLFVVDLVRRGIMLMRQIRIDNGHMMNDAAVQRASRAGTILVIKSYVPPAVRRRRGRIMVGVLLAEVVALLGTLLYAWVR